MKALFQTSLLLLLLTTVIAAYDESEMQSDRARLLNEEPTTHCFNYLYAPQCVADSRCGWCCNVTAVNKNSLNFYGNPCVDLTISPAAYAQCGFYAVGAPLMLTRHVFPNLTTVTTTQTSLPYFPTTPDSLLTTVSAPPPSPTPSTTVAPMSAEPSCTANVCNMITKDLFGESTCSRCVASGSCYYCLSLGLCVGGRQYCPGGEILNTCSRPSSSSPSTGLFGISLTTGAIIFVIIAFVTIAGCGGLVVALKLRRSWRERRIEEERARRILAAQTAAAAATEAAATTTTDAAAATPTTAEGEAAATSNGTAEKENEKKKEETKKESSSSSSSEDDDENDEDVCALCYDRPPSIAFLPCYHANFCQECCERIRPAGGTYACPNCRQPVVAMVNFTQKKPLVAGGSSATTIATPKK